MITTETQICLNCEKEKIANADNFNRGGEGVNNLTKTCKVCLTVPVCEKLSIKQALKIERALANILEKSHLPYQKSWAEIKKGIPNFKKIES